MSLLSSTPHVTILLFRLITNPQDGEAGLPFSFLSKKVSYPICKVNITLV